MIESVLVSQLHIGDKLKDYGTIVRPLLNDSTLITIETDQTVITKHQGEQIIRYVDDSPRCSICGTAGDFYGSNGLMFHVSNAYMKYIAAHKFQLQERYVDDGEELNDPVEVADGLLDIIVVAWGSLLSYFGPDKARAMSDEVTRSNLDKINGKHGPIIKRGDGKILKPEGWVGPQLRNIIEGNVGGI